MLAAGMSFRNPVIDTYALAAELYSRRRETGPEAVRLAALARELGLPVHRPHDAAGDVLTTVQVFLALATELDAFEPQTVGSLCELRHRSDPGRPSAGRCGASCAASARRVGPDPLPLRDRTAARAATSPETHSPKISTSTAVPGSACSGGR